MQQAFQKQVNKLQSWCISFLLLSFLFCCSRSDAQPFSGFYLDSAKTCYFTEAAIYFGNTQSLTKTDYSGTILWTKHIDPLQAHADLSFTNEAIYGCNDSSVFKLDTAGNLVWIKVFSSLVYPTPGFFLTISELTSDGNRLFVSTVETDVNYFWYFKSMVTLDTAGNCINAWTETLMNNPIPDVGVAGIAVAQTGGAWIANIRSTGITQHANLSRLDASGNIINGINAAGATPGMRVSSIRMLPDSTYIVVGDGGFVTGSEFIYIVKFTFDGIVLWSKGLYSLYHNGQLTLCESNSVTADSSGIIYFYGRIMDSALVLRPVLIKMDTAGNILSVKSWTNTQLNNSGIGLVDIFYKNGTLYSFCNYYGKPAIISFDTAFSTNCLSPDTFFQIGGSTGTSSNGFQAYTNVSYSPVTTVPQPSYNTLNQMSIPFCDFLEIKEEHNENPTVAVASFPNPFIDDTRISESGSIQLYNKLGEMLYEDKNYLKGQTIDLSFLSGGVYFLQLETKGKRLQQKLVKL